MLSLICPYSTLYLLCIRGKKNLKFLITRHLLYPEIILKDKMASPSSIDFIRTLKFHQLETEIESYCTVPLENKSVNILFWSFNKLLLGHKEPLPIYHNWSGAISVSIAMASMLQLSSSSAMIELLVQSSTLFFSSLIPCICDCAIRSLQDNSSRL